MKTSCPCVLLPCIDYITGCQFENGILQLPILLKETESEKIIRKRNVFRPVFVKAIEKFDHEGGRQVKMLFYECDATIGENLQRLAAKIGYENAVRSHELLAAFFYGK